MTSRVKVILGTVILAALLAFFNLTGFSNPLRNFFYLISEPFQKILWQAGDKTADFFAAIFKTSVLIKENEELQKRVQQLVQEKIQLQELKKENQSLREALNLGLQAEFELKLVEVTGKDISRDFLMINKGIADGLSLGLPVITSQKVLVGRVGEVFKNFSKVFLISEKENSFDGKLADSDISGVIKGKGNSRLSLEFVSREKEVKEGDSVITGSLGGIFPPDLLVGFIKGLEKSDVEPFQKIEVKPAFEPQELKEVFVIIRF